MRGFAVGSIVLIAMYVALNNKNAITAAGTGGGVVVSGLRRLISPAVAGIPQRVSAIPQASAGGPSIIAPGPSTGVPVPPNN